MADQTTPVSVPEDPNQKSAEWQRLTKIGMHAFVRALRDNMTELSLVLVRGSKRKILSAERPTIGRDYLWLYVSSSEPMDVTETFDYIELWNGSQFCDRGEDIVETEEGEPLYFSIQLFAGGEDQPNPGDNEEEQD